MVHLLRLHWLPEQIALTLARLHPSSHEQRVSHETIYNCIYASITTTMAEGGHRIKAGQTVRLLDVPAQRQYGASTTHGTACTSLPPVLSSRTP